MYDDDYLDDTLIEAFFDPSELMDLHTPDFTTLIAAVKNITNNWTYLDVYL